MERPCEVGGEGQEGAHSFHFLFRCNHQDRFQNLLGGPHSFLNYLCVCVFFLHVCLYTTYEPGKALNLLELELQVAMSCHVGAESKT